MPIRVTCACGKVLHFKDEFAGRRGKCPACGGIVNIPGQRVVSVAPAPPPLPKGHPLPPQGEVIKALQKHPHSAIASIEKSWVQRCAGDAETASAIAEAIGNLGSSCVDMSLRTDIVALLCRLAPNSPVSTRIAILRSITGIGMATVAELASIPVPRAAYRTGDEIDELNRTRNKFNDEIRQCVASSLADQDRTVRLAALDILVQEELYGFEFEEVLIAMTKDNDREIRAGAVRALGPLAVVSSLEDMIYSILDDPKEDSQVRRIAEQTIRKHTLERGRRTRSPEASVSELERAVTRVAELRIAQGSSSPVLKGSLTDIQQFVSDAKNASWNDQEDVVQLKDAIKNTWGVDCQVLRLSQQQSEALKQQNPMDTNLQSGVDEYQTDLSSNSIFIHTTGVWIRLPYVMFLYRNRLYYVNIEPFVVQLRRSIFNKDDTLYHMAKIMITLNYHIGTDEDGRKTLLILLSGNLSQTT